ncbi:MAG: UMP kinase [Alphaproteobacteria bacterium]|nr:MAG: UMP kinase [Alphaproteobacteria bacterium]
MGSHTYGLDAQMVSQVADDIYALVQSGCQVALVVGGGNIFRGMRGAEMGLERTTSDHMGMLATVINGLAMHAMLTQKGCRSRVLSAVPMPNFCESFTSHRAREYLDSGEVVICAAGSGNPYFTTDTAAVLRAVELTCTLLLKGTKFDGIYTADPAKDVTAEHLSSVSYADVVSKKLHVMDMTAITLAQENALPIAVFSIYKKGQLGKVMNGTAVCTYVS